MTYFLHSTIWILLVALAVKLPVLNSAKIKNYLWKPALVGGLATSIFAFEKWDVKILPADTNKINSEIVAATKTRSSTPASTVKGCST